MEIGHPFKADTHSKSLKECSWEIGNLLVRASEGDSYYKMRCSRLPR